ncbi:MULTISPECIES: bile acid:sodium symporter family protein [Lysinibacillus]|uniref:bile acid:sodium symporter family protein n=1 Tax=Lysinibacillus TaxID=400634 RepID=UPI0021A842F6|nr:bile acid:sodium symporter family protein [Lysinibacillus capsici]MCT1541105.1 bile acid:sodium symporter family protein [Lysinibacillus capsici]MCT1572401.1 bile acid:sodium symporter family protein [Lysinibacillus capsici]MCT1649507.1 bile acid:sodium symporter family protein [Lysinibacillus capsici]MCT1728045.1 bile acid:sodium symporter family protein [Lysinibacillus capsici]MCT1785668.1 bile acid:sodium symporter family protein [Lysinibacillus capsici]
MKILEAISTIAGKYFAIWVICIAVIAFIAPEPFLIFGGYITILLGIVMFGMGLTLKAVDFKLVITNPVPVIIGVCAQYVIMPLSAFLIAYIMNLPAELAAGLVLLGSVPGGTASNVMVYLAKGNVPLSITMTSFSTLLAPIATPLILLLLAGKWMPVDPIAMFTSIIQVIIIPIILGIVIRRVVPQIVEKSINVIPLISVVAIMIIVSAVVAGNVDTIASAGSIIFAAVVLHNAFGLLFGYITARVLGLDESNRRAISIEVGMQNSGLGVALATAHFGPLAALPSVLGAVWHNISGPILATYWSKKPEKPEVQYNKQMQEDNGRTQI